MNIDIVTSSESAVGAYAKGKLTVGKELNVFIDGIIDTCCIEGLILAVRAGNYATINIGGELLSITNNAIHSDPNDYTVNYGIYG